MDRRVVSYTMKLHNYATAGKNVHFYGDTLIKCHTGPFLSEVQFASFGLLTLTHRMFAMLIRP